MAKKGLLVTTAIILVILVGSAMSLWFLSRPILIGIVVPIDTSLGNEENLFMRYYQGTHRGIGLRPVKFLIENPPANEAAVNGAYQRLDKEGVSVIVGGVLSQDGTWLADAAAKAGIPTFGITSSTALLSGKKDGFFRLCPTNASQAMAVGQYYQDKVSKRLMLVTSVDNIAYVNPFLQVIEENFGGEIVQVPFTSMDEVSRKMAEVDPDGIFNILPAKDVIQVIKATRQLRPDILIGSSSWGSVEILSLYSGPLLDGVLFFSVGLDVQGEGFKAEIADFEGSYHMNATNGSHYAISLLTMIYDAFRKVGSSREALMAYFETSRAYDTSYGRIAIDEYGDGMINRITILHTLNGTLSTKEIIDLKLPGQPE